GQTVVPDGSFFQIFQSQDAFLLSLNQISLAPAILLAASGIVYLLYGWKIFKILVVCNALMFGAIFGTHIGLMFETPNMPLYMAIGGGALLGMLSWPTMKYAVAVMGGLAGALLGFGVWQYVSAATRNVEMARFGWAGALIGLVLLGMLAFILFRVAVIGWTSFQGAMMIVAGLVALLLKHQQFHQNVNQSLQANVHLLPLLIGVPAGIGFIFQDAALVKKSRRRRPSSGTASAG
ncbi:MAG: DUF4203 domain-containing protein, partial [Planctomycetota bacterium]